MGRVDVQPCWRRVYRTGSIAAFAAEYPVGPERVTEPVVFDEWLIAPAGALLIVIKRREVRSCARNGVSHFAWVGDARRIVKGDLVLFRIVFVDVPAERVERNLPAGTS